MIRSAARFTITTLLVGVAACTSLPDTSGYTKATAELKQSAVAAGAVMRAELARTADQIPGEQRQQALFKAGTDFDAAWQVTVNSLAAMGDYAQSVEDLTNAGNHGSQSAQELSQKVLTLGSVFGFVPGAAVAGTVSDTLALLNSVVANVRASRSIAASLAAADPIMQDIANRVTGQVNLAKQTFDALISEQRAEIDRAFTDVHDIDAALRFAETDAARRATGPAGDSGLQADLTRLRDTRTLMAPRLAEYQAARDAVTARERAGHDLFLATQTALQNWADGHHRLVTAVRERRPVSFESLLAASQDVRSLVQRWRDL